MARGESRKRKPGTPDYRKRFWAAVTAIVVAAGSIGVSHAGFTLPNQAQKQVQMAAAETEPAERTAKKQVPNVAKRSLELEDAQGIQEADAAAVADQSELESDKTTASGFQSVDETVYATENLLNVRSGCGTEYEIVTQLNQGDSVQRVGIGDGWSEVLYKDKSCFIRSEYLTTTEPGSEEAPSPASQLSLAPLRSASWGNRQPVTFRPNSSSSLRQHALKSFARSCQNAFMKEGPP